jgi:hypothetical protein
MFVPPRVVSQPMCLYRRVLIFGRPAAPWRPSLTRAEQDATTLGVGERDEWGVFFLSAEASFEEAHAYELSRRSADVPELSMTKPDRGSRSAHRPAL